MSAPLLSRHDAVGRHERQDDPERETGAADLVIRVVATASVLTVAAIAAYVSYWHAYALVSAASGTGLLAHLEPFTVDGLVCASSMVTLYAARHQLREPRLTRWTLAIGIAASLVANGAQGHSGGAAGRVVVASWPPLSLVLSYEQLQWIVRSARSGRRRSALNYRIEPPLFRQTTDDGEESADLEGDPAEAVHDDVNAAAVAVYRFSIKAGSPLSERKLAEMFGKTSRRWARSRIAEARITTIPEPADEGGYADPGAAVTSVHTDESNSGGTALLAISRYDPAGHIGDRPAVNGHRNEEELMSQ